MTKKTFETIPERFEAVWFDGKNGAKIQAWSAQFGDAELIGCDCDGFQIFLKKSGEELRLSKPYWIWKTANGYDFASEETMRREYREVVASDGIRPECLVKSEAEK